MMTDRLVVSALAGSVVQSMRGGIAALAALALSGCAVTTPVDVRSTGASSSQLTAVELANRPDNSDSASQFSSAIVSAFGNSGVRVEFGAPLLADMAFSIASAKDGLALDNADAKTEPTEIDWAAKPRDGSIFDKCDAIRMKGTLLLLDRASGDVAYRGEAQMIDCAISDQAVRSLASELVSDALGNR